MRERICRAGHGRASARLLVRAVECVQSGLLESSRSCAEVFCSWVGVRGVCYTGLGTGVRWRAGDLFCHTHAYAGVRHMDRGKMLRGSANARAHFAACMRGL